MMLTAYCKPKIKVGAEFVTKGMNMDQVNYNVGAMAKGLFSRVFGWLVKKCNMTLETGQTRAMFIGVLDIAGFEIFDVCLSWKLFHYLNVLIVILTHCNVQSQDIDCPQEQSNGHF